MWNQKSSENNEFNIRSLQELIDETRPSSRPSYKKWIEIEKQVIEQGKASSLPEYFIFEYYSNKKDIGMLAKEIGVSQAALGKFFKKLGIRTKSLEESQEEKMKTAQERREAFKECVSYEIEMYQRGLIPQLSTDKEWARALGVSKKYIRSLAEEELGKPLKKYRTHIIKSHNSRIQYNDPEFRRRLNEGTKRYRSNPKVKEEYKNRMKERMADPESKRKASEWMKSLNANPKFKAASRIRGRNAAAKLHANPIWQEKHRKASSETMRRLHENPEWEKRNIKRAEDTLKRLNNNPDYKVATKERGRRQYADQEFRSKFREGLKRYLADPQTKRTMSERMRRMHKNPEFKRRTSERMKLRQADPKFKEAVIKKLKEYRARPEVKAKYREIGIRSIDIIRKTKYFVDNRFYAQSLQEGATALLLEKYVPGYEVKEGTNFQIKDKGISKFNGGIDFLVKDEFFEWHPIILADKRKENDRGDIPQEEARSYYKVLSELSEEEKEQFKKDYSNVLALNYRNRRQYAVNNSGYSGLNVALATDERELYDFISRYSNKLPSFEDFKREFGNKCKYVKTFAVQKAKKPEEELELVLATD